jgi:hypothetical protein
MAKGNNGNLLQHAVETAAAKYLVGEDGRELHFVATHAMRPFEAFEQRGANPGAFRLLERWLDAARNPENDDDPAVLAGYRATNASETHYPNTGELLATIVPRRRLSGSVCEVNTDKIAELEQAWSESEVAVRAGSWRRSLIDLAAPRNLRRPWLFTMDPMSFTTNEPTDDAMLRSLDLRLVEPVLSTFFETAQAGAAVIFCFSLRPDMQRNFDDEVRRRIRDQIDGAKMLTTCTTARGGNRHLGVVVSCDEELLRAVKAEWEAIAAGP